MADVEINDVGQFGVVRDKKSHLLTPEIWTRAYNVISKDKGMQAMKGWDPVFGTPLYAPHFAIPATTVTGSFWLYTSLTKAAVFDGSDHTDITRLSADYAAPATKSWNGLNFAGIPILNNGVDKPQFWGGPPVSTKLADLSNWPASASAMIVRSLGAFLIGFNWTISAEVFPHLVKWSNEAEGPGTLPSSWDSDDPTVDAGAYDLVDDKPSGIILEAKRLGTRMMVYKGEATWWMRFVGGRATFQFDTFSDTTGILAPRCVETTGDGKKHVVATLDDIIIHDGNSGPASILEEKMRSTIFNNIDPTNYSNSFMFRDLANSNIIFAYPELGRIEPNRGLIFNYVNGAITECDIGFANAASGQFVEASEASTWEDDTGSWEIDEGPWNSFSRRALLLCDKANSLFHRWDIGYERNGVTYEVTLQRTGLALVGKKRTGEPIVDFQKQKYVDRVWPKASGGPILCRLGYQQTVDGAVAWGPYQTFDPLNDMTVDTDASGRAICIEFTTPQALEWRLEGYKLPVQVLSEF